MKEEIKFKIEINGQAPITAGLAHDRGVVTLILYSSSNSRGMSASIYEMKLGGFDCATMNHTDWGSYILGSGDQVSISIVKEQEDE